MAYGLIDDLETLFNGDKPITKGHHRSMVRWSAKAHEVVEGKLGYINNLAVHYFHGSKKNRSYAKRHEILADHNYDPAQDLSKDHQGLLILNPNKHDLLRDISLYFKSRNEDSIEA